MAEWRAEWSGVFPHLCFGEWTLYKDDVEITDIPFKKSDASTHGIYEEWSFDDNWLEYSTSYEDGLSREEWIETYEYWLSKIADKEDYPKIYEAFNESDFRAGSCGGCV